MWHFGISQTFALWQNIPERRRTGTFWPLHAEPISMFPHMVLTCLPATGPSHQTVSSATWVQGKDKQTALSLGDRTQGVGFILPDPQTGTQETGPTVPPHLSICSGVWAFWVSATSQLRPVIHRLMSSSQKAGGGRGEGGENEMGETAPPGWPQGERGPRTGHAERPQPEVHPVEDDEAHGEVELAGVLGVALKVPRVLPQADLLDLPNVDCGDRGDTGLSPAALPLRSHARGSGRLWEVGLCRNHVFFGEPCPQERTSPWHFGCPPREMSPQPRSDVSTSVMAPWVPRVLQGHPGGTARWCWVRDSSRDLCPQEGVSPGRGVPRKGCPHGAPHHHFPRSAGATSPPSSAFPILALQSLQPPSPLLRQNPKLWDGPSSSFNRRFLPKGGNLQPGPQGVSFLPRCSLIISLYKARRAGFPDRGLPHHHIAKRGISIPPWLRPADTSGGGSRIIKFGDGAG